MSFCTQFRWVLFTAALSACLAPVSAQMPFREGNLVVATTQPFGPKLLIEYNADESIRQRINVPDIDGPQAYRDLDVDYTGQVQLFNGWGNPALSTYHPTTGQWTNRTYPGWSSFGNINPGGLAAFQHYVFALDTRGALAGETFGQHLGILRFDMWGTTTERIAGDIEYFDITLGGDGLLYASSYDYYGSPPKPFIHVYDPLTLSLERTIIPDTFVDNIAVAPDGTFYSASVSFIGRYDRNGRLLNSSSNPFGDSTIVDIARSPDGHLAFGTGSGEVFLMDANLSQMTGAFFASTAYPVHVAFVPTGLVPEPSTGTLGALLIATGTFVRLRRRR
jgi:hypothetical protein